MLRPSAALLLALAQAGQSITLASPGTFRAELLVHAQDNATNFGTTALGLGQNGLPVVMFGSDLSPPFEIAAFEASDRDRNRNRDRRRETESHPIWTFDTTAVADRQMTTVVSTNTATATDTSRIDSVIFWVTKTRGIFGDCSIIAFNSQQGPRAQGTGDQTKPGWSAMVVRDHCDVINMPNLWRHVAISRDGSTVATASFAGRGNVSVSVFDGQSGALRWQKAFIAPNDTVAEYWGNNGVAVTDDGSLVVFDAGDFDTGAPTPIYIAASGPGSTGAAVRTGLTTNAPRIPAFVSGDGSTVVTGDNTQGTGALHVHQYGGGVWTKRATLRPPAAVGVWTINQAAIGTNHATGRMIVGVSWTPSDLQTAQVAVFEICSGCSPSAVSSFQTQRGGSPPGSMSIEHVACTCAGGLCAFPLHTYDEIRSQPSVVVLSSKSKSPGLVFNYSTTGSMFAAALMEDSTHGSVYLSVAGCTTYATCTGPGAEGFLWRLSEEG